MFWAVHRAYTAARSEEGADAANDYQDSLKQIIGLKKETPKLSMAEEEAILRASGAIQIQ